MTSRYNFPAETTCEVKDWKICSTIKIIHIGTQKHLCKTKRKTVPSRIYIYIMYLFTCLLLILIQHENV